jgi:tRNA G46 methylase TrmB
MKCAGGCLCGMRRNARNRLSQKIRNDSRVLLSGNQYAVLLPSDKNSAILDIGFGGGWFLAAS